MNRPKVSPYTALYSEINNILEKTNIPYYDFIPSENVDYPFIIFNDLQFNIVDRKVALLGVANITIHFWDILDRKGSLIETMDNLVFEINKIYDIMGYRWKTNLNSTNYLTRIDTSTSQPLIHGILYMELNMI